jgi:hypothetical protein
MRNLRFALAAAGLALALGVPAAAEEADPAAENEEEGGCLYNDVLYPPGTRIGALLCTDGQWAPG